MRLQRIVAEATLLCAAQNVRMLLLMRWQRQAKPHVSNIGPDRLLASLGSAVLLAFVAPVICGVFWFAVIAMGAMFRKWLHRSR